MSDFFRRLSAHPRAIVAFFAVGFLWNAVYVVWRIRKLRRSGKTILARVPEGALFVEKWTSGGSSRSVWTRLGGAANCLRVALTRERLLIRPHCPFILFAERFDLDHEVPLADVAGVRLENGLIHMELPGRVFVLRLRDPEKFLSVWKLVRGV